MRYGTEPMEWVDVAQWAHVICDAETEEPALLSDAELEEVEDCLGTSRCVLKCYIRPATEESA